MTLIQCPPLDRSIAWLRAGSADAQRVAERLSLGPTLEDTVFAITLATREAPCALHDLGVVLSVLAEPGGDPPPPHGG